AEFAASISIPHLTRAWQMLLKGLKEIEFAPDALMAAEMVLIRLAHAANLPSGEDLVRLAREPGGESRSAPPKPPMQTARDLPPVTTGQLAPKHDAAEERPAKPVPESRPFAHLRDVANYAGEKRDIRLKNQIETMMRHVRVSAGQIEVALEPSAPPGLPGELSRKLEAWTGYRWMVLVAREGGEKPLALQSREARDTVLREVREHPDVQAILKQFPGAEIVNIRDFEGHEGGEDGSGEKE
ncbi:MAG: DNA polymerase III subunit gamma/tau, partial [Parvibaculaceae bacterium]